MCSEHKVGCLSKSQSTALEGALRLKQHLSVTPPLTSQFLTTLECLDFCFPLAIRIRLLCPEITTFQDITSSFPFCFWSLPYTYLILCIKLLFETLTSFCFPDTYIKIMLLTNVWKSKRQISDIQQNHGNMKCSIQRWTCTPGIFKLFNSTFREVKLPALIRYKLIQRWL